jgi:hypothetical protein
VGLGVVEYDFFPILPKILDWKSCMDALGDALKYTHNDEKEVSKKNLTENGSLLLDMPEEVAANCVAAARRPPPVIP